LAFAKRCGKRNETEYTNAEGGLVHFEFVGVMDLLERGAECEEDGYEVAWYDIVTLKTPFERRDRLIPENSKLLRKLSTK
jgi:hypothetical protein